jgi:carboxyl-terminal processing protease
MLARKRFTTTLAILTTVTATFSLQESPENEEGFTSGVEVRSAEDQSGRYFSNPSEFASSSQQVRPASGSGAIDAPEVQASWVRLSDREISGGSASRNFAESIDQRADVGGNRLRTDFLRNGQNPLRSFPIPGSRNTTIGDLVIRSQDPFIPVPSREQDSEWSAIDKLIAIRYENPATVRAIRAVSRSQALQLFSEVSQKIDERSLEPTSYDTRVRRGLRDLTIALNNDTFLEGLGLNRNSFQLDGYRNTLGRLAESGPFRDFEQARSVLVRVMDEAETVRGLTAGVVGFEFTNASIDTLDKFSGLEPADPALRSRAGIARPRSNGLEEQVVGIGIEVREHADGLIVVRPLRGGPAEEAGITTGDIIVGVDGRDLHGMKLASSVDSLKGPIGSTMRIRTFREGLGERNHVLKRRTVRVWTVNDTKILTGTDVGFFSLSRFSENSTAEVDQALETLHDKGMKSLIIDLRGNPGGLLTTCVEITDRFVPCGIIVSTNGRLSSDNMIQEARYSKTWNVPLVVLIDGDSASASEIFAAAIQENNRGLIVGSRSYGKGSVQSHFPLTSIEGELRLTTALFYSPTGKRMSGRGVAPDVEVNDPDGVLNGDEVLAEAERIAQGKQLQDLAKAADSCRPQTAPPIRSSQLPDISDPTHDWPTIL